MPARERFPSESTLNFETPPTWKSARFPPNVDAAFIASCVPLAEPLNAFVVYKSNGPEPTDNAPYAAEVPEPEIVKFELLNVVLVLLTTNAAPPYKLSASPNLNLCANPSSESIEPLEE